MRKVKNQSFLALVFITFLLFFSGIDDLFHNHSDPFSHDDCFSCVIQVVHFSQEVDAFEQVFAAILFIVFFQKRIKLFYQQSYFNHFNFSRAPPLT